MSGSLSLRVVLVVTVCCLLALVLWGHIASNAVWASVLTNSAHGPVFSAIAVILLILRREHIHSPRSLWWNAGMIVLAAIVAGVIIELVQGVLGRDAEVQDVFNDALGAIAGAGFYIYFNTPKPARHASALLAAPLASAVLASILLLLPSVTVATAYLLRNLRFPVLIDANATLGSYFLDAYDGITVERTRLPAELQPGPSATEGLHVTGAKGPWAFGFWETCADWRGKQFYAIKIANPTDQQLELWLRLFDQRHERNRQYGFHSNVQFKPHSVSTARIPLKDLAMATGRQHVDLSAMAGVIVSGPPVPDVRGLYLIKMWLE